MYEPPTSTIHLPYLAKVFFTLTNTCRPPPPAELT
jgi:hypothetical protein